MGKVRGYSPPAPLQPDHDLSGFDCGIAPLNDWLSKRAGTAEGKSARCYVTLQAGKLAGYYCLAAGAVAHAGAPRKIRQNMPDPVPVLIIGRLAVDRRHQGGGLGRSLLKDALGRIVQSSHIIGARAVLVHAITAEAAAFYRQYGFQAFASEPQTLFLPIAEIEKSRA